jgi:hypothetical protein
MLARQTGRKYEDLYAEHHGTMRFWGDAELTAKQIARIQRIRAERAAKKAAPDCCHTCGDISDEYTCRDGKLYCDGCEAVRHNNITDWCESLNVDDRDSPNVFPYKKCAFCHERSSCGNYTNDDQWQCECCDDQRRREEEESEVKPTFKYHLSYEDADLDTESFVDLETARVAMKAVIGKGQYSWVQIIEGFDAVVEEWESASVETDPDEE